MPISLERPHIVPSPSQRVQLARRPASTFELLPGAEYFSELRYQTDYARRSNRMQSFIWDNDPQIGGPEFDSLEQAAARSVDGKILLDHVFGLGNLFTFRRLLRRLWGINPPPILKNMPLVGQRFQKEPFLDFRFAREKGTHPTLLQRFTQVDHNKNLVIDAEIPGKGVAYVGGRNVAGEDVKNHDFMVRMRGEIVQFAKEDFDKTWQGSNTRPQIYRDSDGNELIADSRNTDQIPERFVQAIRSAKKRIWIETPYYDRLHLQELLIDMKKQNPLLDIRLVTPRPWSNNHKFTFGAETPFFTNELVENGIRVYWYRKGNREFSHAKGMIVDDLAIVGSSNFSQLNLLAGQNAEMEVFTRNTHLISQLEGWFGNEFLLSEFKKPSNNPFFKFAEWFYRRFRKKYTQPVVNP